jgi:hypothetical protein
MNTTRDPMGHPEVEPIELIKLEEVVELPSQVISFVNDCRLWRVPTLAEVDMSLEDWLNFMSDDRI